MHELSIAMSILDVAEEEAERRHCARIFAIHLKLGALAGVVKEALLSSYDLAREGTALAETRLVIEDVPIEIYCPACEARRPVKSLQDISCAVCGTPSDQLLTGRELEIAAMEIET